MDWSSNQQVQPYQGSEHCVEVCNFTANVWACVEAAPASAVQYTFHTHTHTQCIAVHAMHHTMHKHKLVHTCQLHHNNMCATAVSHKHTHTHTLCWASKLQVLPLAIVLLCTRNGLAMSWQMLDIATNSCMPYQGSKPYTHNKQTKHIYMSWQVLNTATASCKPYQGSEPCVEVCNFTANVWAFVEAAPASAVQYTFHTHTHKCAHVCVHAAMQTRSMCTHISGCRNECNSWMCWCYKQTNKHTHTHTHTHCFWIVSESTGLC